MGTKTPDGAKRLDGLAWRPENLFLVGVDARPDGTIDGPEHPRWDPRALLPGASTPSPSPSPSPSPPRRTSSPTWSTTRSGWPLAC